ncbi:hypothetical protein N2598_09490 [Sinorhizobium medicae]|nr:hypothetical protein [Sinorhizobium medicae]UWU06618.1 hypothetical protein N2598_09490 [Sinorhizobium medicae]
MTKQTDSDVFWLASPVAGRKDILWSRQGADGRMLVMCFQETSVEIPTSQSAGEPWTLNFSKSHNAGNACSFWQVLIEASTQEAYSLSETAKSGILRRANARNKKLPAAVRAALES